MVHRIRRPAFERSAGSLRKAPSRSFRSLPIRRADRSVSQRAPTGTSGSRWRLMSDLPGNAAIGRITPDGVAIPSFRWPMGANLAVSPRAPTGTCGSSWRAPTPSAASRRHRGRHGVPGPNGPRARPAAIAAGADGNLWFAEHDAPTRSAASRPSGVITEFPIPTPGSDTGGDHSPVPTEAFGSTSSPPTRSAASRPQASSPSSRFRRRTAHPTGQKSPPVPTETCGSRRTPPTRSAA